MKDEEVKNNISFEKHIKEIAHEAITNFIIEVKKQNQSTLKKYITIKELSSKTGIGVFVLRQLTYARAMPHLRVKSRLIFEENEIKETIEHYKTYGWENPKGIWDVEKAKYDIKKIQQVKEGPVMIDEAIRQIFREELISLSDELKKFMKMDKESYYGSTILTVKEAAKYFRTSPSTIYSLINEEGMPHIKIHSRSYIVLEEAEAFLWRETAKHYAEEGNIYWQRILQRLDWEEQKRKASYEKALKRLEDSTL